MSRPSKNTDEKLIKAALELLPTTGYSGLSMRTVAKKAGVNLGMFHYHFKNKEAFIQRVTSSFYEEFFRKFTLEIESGKDTEEQLRKAIRTLVFFGRDNRKLVVAMIKDVLDGNRQLVRMLEEFVPRHGIVLVRLLRECQKQGVVAKAPLPLVMTYFMGAMLGPVIMAAVLERVRLRPPYDLVKKTAVPYILSDKVIEKRLDMVLRGIVPMDMQGLDEKQWEKRFEAFLKSMEKDQKKGSTKPKQKSSRK
ncbi:TetR/AcrR family transcriptional regulator [bacterium]|nr:TetR/AcrR family transcriptional regulator [bacterium]